MRPVSLVSRLCSIHTSDLLDNPSYTSSRMKDIVFPSLQLLIQTLNQYSCQFDFKVKGWFRYRLQDRVPYSDRPNYGLIQLKALRGIGIFGLFLQVSKNISLSCGWNDLVIRLRRGSVILSIKGEHIRELVVRTRNSFIDTVSVKYQVDPFITRMIPFFP